MHGTSNQTMINKTTIYDKCEAFDERQWIAYCVRKQIGYAYMKHIWKLTHPERRKSTIYEEDIINTQMIDTLKEFQYDFEKPLIIIGPPGCGKTNWAKLHAAKPALFVTHLDRLKEFDETYHKSIIFDDMDFNHLPRQGQIHLVDYENPRDIHIRYNIVNIPAGVQKLFTANFMPFTTDPAVARRTKMFNLFNQIIPPPRLLYYIPKNQ